MNFLEKLKYLMKENNLNKSSLSDACGIPYATIDGWYKKGFEDINIITLKKLADYFNVSIDHFAYDIIPTINNLNIHERLLEIRKTLHMSTRDFAQRINLTGGTVTNMEKGRRNITNRTIKDICREFNVNEEWLRYGTGTIFIENSNSLEKCLEENNATAEDIKLIKCYLGLDLEIRKNIHKHFEAYFNNI